jgi:hypothetical protein
MSSNIHIRVGYPEAISSKKNMLGSEKALLELVKKIKIYSVLRKKEFTLKNKLKKDLSSVKNEVMKIEDDMPKDSELKIPKKKIEKEISEEISLEEAKEKIAKKTKKRTARRKSKKSNLDVEIEEIEKKLAQLS